MRFPVFLELTDKKILVIGGGTIATRRITSLLTFGAKIVVIAPELTHKLQDYVREGAIVWEKRCYIEGDCIGAYMVLSCTNAREWNRLVYEEAKSVAPFFNICDCKEESNFYFPGIAKKGNVVIGVTASGTNHKLAKRVTEEIRNIIESESMEGE